MKTLEELKQEMDIALAAWDAARAVAAARDAWGAWYDADDAWDAYAVACAAYNKKLREVESEDT